ncbi:PaaI family thioesterase [Williamsia sterculiae]|nr:PaaI family thioesterase [Williamsia sterculiae]
MSTGLDETLGLELVSASGDGSRATIEIGPRHLQPFGIVHGGVYCAVVESLASISAAVWLRETGVDGLVVGVNNNTDFLKSVRGGRLTATSRPVHRGRRQQLWNVDIVDVDDRLVAQGRVRLQNLENS